MALIELESVTRRFGSNVAVRDLSLRVEAGEIYAFLGPNGAGKTTTIKMIVGLLSPDAGRLRVCGYDMSRDGRSAKALLAYVPDQPFLYDKLTGAEFLHFVGRMYGMDAALVDRRLAELIDQLGLADFLDQYAQSYSHGMRQRVVLAAALLHQPRVLVVDEPMVGLDPVIRRAVKQLFREMREAGGAVFLSTHTLETAEDLADRIGIIDRANLVAEGTLDSLKDQAGRSGRLEEAFLTIVQDDSAAGSG